MEAGISAPPRLSWRHCEPGTLLHCRSCSAFRSHPVLERIHHSKSRVLRRRLEKALFGRKLGVKSNPCITNASWFSGCWTSTSQSQSPGSYPRCNKSLLEAMALTLACFPTKSIPLLARLLAALHNFGPFQEFLSVLQLHAAAAPRPALPVHANFAKVDWSTSTISSMLDTMLERHPMSYALLLTFIVAFLTFGGGALFYSVRSYEQKLDDSIWDAWGFVTCFGMHLKENTRLERFMGFVLAMMGMLVYSLLMNLINTQFKSHVDYLREGAHSQVYEKGHVVVCGANNHLQTILKQINKRQRIAYHNGTSRSRRQTVLLLSERPRSETDKLVVNLKALPHLDILTRSGSLTSTMSFLRVAADKARSVVFLANKDNGYEADADVVLSVLAFGSLLDKFQGEVIAEVSKASTADLLKSMSNTKVHNVQNLSSKLFVQCSRQPALRDVYRQLLSYGGHVINLYKYPSLSGLHYQQVRRGVQEAVVCGLLREGKLDFHPKDDLVIRSNDKLLVIAPKGSQRDASKTMSSAAERFRKTMGSIDKMGCDCRTGDSYPAKPAAKAGEKHAGKKERIVMLGWRPDAADMVLEYDDYVGPGSELVILAETSLHDRSLILDRKISKPLKNLTLTHRVGNPMSRTDLRNAILGVAPDGDKDGAPPLSIVVISDDKWHVGADPAKSDKQSAFALLLAEALCKQYKIKISSLVGEFVEKGVGKQVVQSHPSLNYVCPHELTGLVTAQVTEDSDLNLVWTELLNSWGNEIYVQDIEMYASMNEALSFNELVERAVVREEVAIGYKRGNKVIINPQSKEIPIRFRPGDALVVIAEAQYGG